MSTTVGIIANPVSARDIRRLITNASSLQVADRANIVMRMLASLGSVGVKHVVMMPDNGGVRGHVQRGLIREKNTGGRAWPKLEFLEMPVYSSVEDTLMAVRKMVALKVSAILVLGGDGTHRAVASVCDGIPIAGLSTGTNNAFPDYREPTITGLAAGLYVTGQIEHVDACVSNKMLNVSINGSEQKEIALVDVAITTDRYVGARALWRTDTFRELYVTYGEPHGTGMSSIAGLIDPVSRRDPHGLMIELGPCDECGQTLTAPIAPGLMSSIGIKNVEKITADKTYSPMTKAGSIALDGEREIEFSENDRVEITLQCDAFITIDVERAMATAAKNQLLLST